MFISWRTKAILSFIPVSPANLKTDAFNTAQKITPIVLQPNTTLINYERFADVNDAIAREKQIKAGSRKRKIDLIEKDNPNWLDLFETKIGPDWL